MNLKRLSSYVAVFIAGAALATTGQAFGASKYSQIKALLRSDLTITVNDKKLDLVPVMYEDANYLPARAFVETLNGQIDMVGNTVKIVTSPPSSTGQGDPQVTNQDFLSFSDVNKYLKDNKIGSVSAGVKNSQIVLIRRDTKYASISETTVPQSERFVENDLDYYSVSILQNIFPEVSFISLKTYKKP